MDTNKENELMLNLAKNTPPSAVSYRADGVPLKAGVKSQAVNPATQTLGNNSSQAKEPQSESAMALARVTPEMVNRIEMYGAEAVYNADPAVQ